MRKTLIAFLLCLAPITVLAQNSRPAPQVVLKDLRGRSVRLTDFKGKVVLINFWATWCPPCRAEIPDLIKWQREYRSLGLEVIGITVPPTDRRAVRTFMHQLKMNYSVLLGRRQTKALFDLSETLPFSVVVDRKGNVRATIEGILLPEEFDEKVRPVLERAKP